MRSRRTTFSTSIDFNKSVESVVDELCAHLDPNSSTHQLGDRIEAIKNFLQRFKFHFNKAPSSSYRIVIHEANETLDSTSTTTTTTTTTTVKDAEKEFELALEKSHDAISIGLVYNVIQMESSQLRLLSLQTILLLAHFEVFAKRFHQLHINSYIVRLIDLDFSWDDTSLCVEYIRQLAQLWPSYLDKSIVFCLLAALEDYRYRLNFLILETLLEIACRRPVYVAQFNRTRKIIKKIKANFLYNPSKLILEITRIKFKFILKFQPLTNFFTNSLNKRFIRTNFDLVP